MTLCANKAGELHPPLLESRMEKEGGFLGVAVSRCTFGVERIFMETVHKQIQFGRCVGKLLRIRLRRVRMPL